VYGGARTDAPRGIDLAESAISAEQTAGTERRKTPTDRASVGSMNDDELAALVKRSTSIRQVLIGMGLKPAGGNYQIIKRRIAALGLATGHFLGKGHLAGKVNTWHPKTPLSAILVENSLYRGSTYRLKNRLLDEGVFERKCYRCGLSEWLGQPIPLELEHKNGNSSDHRLDNLTLLCPNCHALTETYRGKNIKSYRTRPHCAAAHEPRAAAKEGVPVAGARGSCGSDPSPTAQVVESVDTRPLKGCSP
jgi:hypothetical protein